MNISATPLIAIGTLSGNLPKSATTAAGPLPGANGAPAGSPVGLDESNALQGVVLTPFKQMQVSGGLTLTPAQLTFLQQQFQDQSAEALATQAGGPAQPTT